MAVVKVLGKLLISVGIGILLFVAWTLWGTGIATGRAQERLAREYDALPSFTPIAQGERFLGPPESFQPGPGDPVFHMSIPKIDVRKMVVEGVEVDDLALGPGHYPSCREGFERPLCTPGEEVWPGERGRAIISGHRTTHGAPFWSLDRLRSGDAIDFKTRWGSFHYEVTKTEVVAPTDTAIADPASDEAEVVLTTCNPRFSAAERLVVFARLESSQPPTRSSS